MLGLRAGIRGWTHLACVRWEVSRDNLWSSLALRSVEVQICSQSGGLLTCLWQSSALGCGKTSELPGKVPVPVDLSSLVPEAVPFPRKSLLWA